MISSSEVDGARPGRHPGCRHRGVGAPAAGGGALVGVIGSSLLIYTAFLVARGADPVVVFSSMIDSAFGSVAGVGNTLVRMTPLLLAALATTVPARAGMINIGAEGQLLAGAIGATAVSFALEGSGGPVTLVLIALGGMVAGAAWSGIAAVLKVVFRVNEAIATLLLNYVAGFVLTWLVFGPWKDPASLGQAYTRQLSGAERLPIMWGTRVHLGVVRRRRVPSSSGSSSPGRHGASGSESSAAIPTQPVGRAGRSGSSKSSPSSSAALLAGLGGMLEVTGVEARLRPDMMTGFGYIGFLASWLGSPRSDPRRRFVASSSPQSPSVAMASSSRRGCRRRP